MTGPLNGNPEPLNPFCCFEHWNIRVLNLFRVSIFDIRIFQTMAFTPDRYNLTRVFHQRWRV
ncbi:MAG: hypothetical protein CVU57_16020 [Deltaproteobacteria bacterium HGW-Deltaproteobacteria-15]|nr:MAG: hypothetical protein CVU57_16020 [Deltaproteobacteria bacterium HGW-Deltaproteobacteria-15]